MKKTRSNFHSHIISCFVGLVEYIGWDSEARTLHFLFTYRLTNVSKSIRRCIIEEVLFLTRASYQQEVKFPTPHVWALWETKERVLVELFMISPLSHNPHQHSNQSNSLIIEHHPQ